MGVCWRMRIFFPDPCFVFCSVRRFVWKPGIETVMATIDFAIQIGRFSTKELERFQMDCRLTTVAQRGVSVGSEAPRRQSPEWIESNQMIQINQIR